MDSANHVDTPATRLLAEHGLEHVSLERAPEPPEQSKGGKFRQVVPLKDGTHS